MSVCKIAAIEATYVYAIDVSRTEFAHVQYTAKIYCHAPTKTSFGKNIIQAQIDAGKFSETNSPIGRNGIWDIWARELPFRVYEV